MKLTLLELYLSRRKLCITTAPLAVAALPAFAGSTAPVDVSFSDMIEELDLAFMGSFEISRDRWSFIATLHDANIGAKGFRATGLI